MKPQHPKNKNSPARLYKVTNKGVLNWPLLPGILLADFGLFLIGLAGWDALRARTQILVYSVGAMLCFVGLALIWIGTAKLADAAQESPVRSDGKPLGSNQVLHLTA